MTERQVLAWLEEHKAEVRFREYAPGGGKALRPWCVQVQGESWTGSTIREAVERAAAAKD